MVSAFEEFDTEVSKTALFGPGPHCKLAAIDVNECDRFCLGLYNPPSLGKDLRRL